MIVIFRREKDGSVVALFPYEPVNLDIPAPRRCMCYSHIGQHGEADYFHVVDHSDPVSGFEEDVNELYQELKKLGYDLEIRQRLSPRWKPVWYKSD